MSGDDLTVVLFFAAVGITFMIAGVQGEKWKRRLFISLASVCLVCAIEWDAIKSSSPTIASNISKIANNPASWFSGTMFIATAWVTARYLMKRVSHPEIDRYELAARAESLAQQVSELLGEYMERLENARSEERSERHLREHRDPWSRQSEVEAKATRRFHEQYNREFWSIIALAQKCVPLDFGDIWRVSHGMSFRDIQQVPTILEKIVAGLRYFQPDIPPQRALPPGMTTNRPVAPLPSPTPSDTPGKTDGERPAGAP